MDDFPDEASLERYAKTTPTPPPRALLQDIVRQKEQTFGRELQSSSVHTNPHGETFCFGQFGRGKNSLTITLLWFNPRNGKWYDYQNARTGRYHDVSEAFDPDDPETVLRTHPGFQFRMSSYDGEQVFLRGDSDVGLDSDWPWPIGNVVEGPGHRWYAIGVHRIAPERLDELGLGLNRAFDNKDEAAMAIWRVWSQLPKRDVLDRKRKRRVRETSTGVVSTLLEDTLRPSASIEKDLIKAARKITHCGDYGTLYYHPGTHEVHWNMADSDGAPDYTSSDEIRKLLSLPGITHVELGDEWSPDEDEGWKRLI
jgi:hypothetical protein